MKIALFLASHALLFGAGWLAFHGTQEAAPASDTSRKSGFRNRDAEKEEGKRLVKEMRAAWGTQAEAEKAADYREKRRREADQPREGNAVEEEMAKILKLSAQVQLPADPAAEMKRLEKGDTRALAAFALAWLRADSKAALAFLESNPEIHGRSASRYFFALWVREWGAGAVPDLVEGNPKLRGVVAGFVMQEAAAEDPSSLGDLMARMEGWLDRSELLERAFHKELPEGKRAAALDWITANLKGREVGNSIMKIAINTEDKREGKTFLKAAMAGGLEPEVIEQLKGWGNFHDIMRSGVGPDSPLNERVELLLDSGIEGKTPEEKQASAMQRIATEDVERWLMESFLFHSLKSGDVGAEELWGQVEAALPQFSDPAGRDLMLKAFIQESSLSDPEGALALMQKEGKESEVAEHFLTSIESGIHRNVEASIRLAAVIPTEELRENISLYDRFYSTAINNAAAEYGSFWVDWIQRQPAGLNRDLVMHYTAKRLVKKGKDAEAASLRELIQDLGIKERPLR
ncbi:hypothetical protein [Luteolibacter luteus]|uniref:HEAT repeat domain-containing protein n=1 Tax=Luteolibacter luteus TaxID=2728835 RepID=A0A858RKL9_9BACT|nr:hypothetical protein [Luteolibacter luteus]QJE97044.1 hypothetical protein HHL09_15035 [Luteolibacter luteus]